MSNKTANNDEEVDIGLQQERLGLILRFFAISLLAPSLGWVLAQLWSPQALSYIIIHRIARVISTGGASSESVVGGFGIGIFAGFLCLFTVDWRKRYQGILLIFGTILGLLALASQGLLLPDLDFGNPWVSGALVFGLIMTFVIEAPTFRRFWSRFGRLEADDVVFPRAAVGVFICFSLIPLFTIADSFIKGNTLALVNFPISIIFLYLLFGFVKYESKANVAVMGPRNSGKSLLLLGLYLTYRRRRVAADAQGYMQKLIDQADQMKPDAPKFPISNTPDLEKLSFRIQSGNYFPKSVEISVTDFAGELLETISEEIDNNSSLSMAISRGRIAIKQYFNRDLTNDESLLRFIQELKSPNVMILILDMERMQQRDISHVYHLMKLGKRARDNGSEVMVVATKCDLYIDNEVNSRGNIVDVPLEENLAREFREEITELLTETFEAVDELVNDIGDGTVYPIYYETEKKESDSGEGTESSVQPSLDERGNLQHQGTDELADAIERRL